MDETGARELIAKMVTTFQQFKSIQKESIGDGEAEKVALAIMSPYIFGKKSPLSVMAKMQSSEKVRPHDLFNICYLVHTFIPEFVMAASIMGLEIPECNREWLSDSNWFDSQGKEE